VTDPTLRDAIAAALQARLPWPQADACATDIGQMLERRASATDLYDLAVDLKTRLDDLTIDTNHFVQEVTALAIKERRVVDHRRFRRAADALAAWVATLDLEDDESGYGPERDRLLRDYDKARG